MQNPLNLLNEADVREGFITPLLASLGYRRGTSNDILREHNLTYPRAFLGRKKQSDRPLVGKADYILTVEGAGRWVVEAKPPGVPISDSDIEQALTYARHPEISAALCVVTNGLETHLYEANSVAGLEAAGVICETDPLKLAEQLKALIGPIGFAHRFRRRVVTLEGGISMGYPEHCDILAGSATYDSASIDHNLPQEAVNQFQTTIDSLRGYVSHLSGGSVFIEDDRIKVLTDWSMPNEKMRGMSEQIGLGTRIIFESQESGISQKPEFKTFFDANIDIRVDENSQIVSHAFDVARGAGINMSATVNARAKGFIDRNRLIGDFFTEYYFRFPDFPQIQMSVEGFGSFSLIIDI